MNEDFRIDKHAYLDYLKGRILPGEEFPECKTYHWYMYNIKFSVQEFKDFLYGNSFETIDTLCGFTIEPEYTGN